MFKVIIRWLNGYLLLKTGNDNAERFINMCRYHGIFLWKICREKEDMLFYMTMKDYKYIYTICRKKGIFLHIVGKNGLPFVIHSIMLRHTLLPCFALFCLTVNVLSGFVWKIEINGQKTHTQEELLQFLSSNENIHEILPLKKIKCNNIEKAIRNEFNDISWVSVDLCGCNMNIKIKESENIDRKTDIRTDYSNIVASCNGTVESIITRTGTPLVIVGEKVKKGQVLVKGIVEYTDDAGVVYKRKPVYADSDIMIRSKKKYRDSFEMIYEKRLYTGKKQKKYEICINDKVYFFENILNKLEKYKKYDIIEWKTDMKKIRCFFDDFYINQIIISEYDIIYSTYTNNEAKKLATRRLNNYIKKLCEAGCIINNKNILFQIINGKFCSEGVFDISIPQKNREIMSADEWSVIDYNEQKRNDN